MTQLTNEISRQDVLEFIDFSNIEKNCAETGTATIEFLNSREKWCRGRFIVSERTEDGRIAHVLWATENIDDEKRERDELRDASERALAASEAKSSFLSNMSHEIRTPINAVLGMNEMILRECDDNNILGYSESIKTAGSTLLGIVNDILDFSKIEAGKMEIIPVDYDLSSVNNDLVNMIQTKADDRGLKLILKISSDVPKFLHGDEVRIKQVITNILTNAVKYTEEGSVTLSVNCEKLEQMMIRYLPESKVKHITEETESASDKKDDGLPGFLSDVGEINTNTGITNNGNVAAYLETLKVFANNSEKYTQEIESFYASDDIKNATVKIHALKSTTRIIGATDLGELAQELEDAGKAEDRAVLKEKLPGLLERARKLGKDLAPLTSDSGDTDENKQQISVEELEEAFAKIKESAEDCDDTVIEETLEMLSGYDLPDAEREKVDAIKAAFEDFDFDSIAELL